jgi:hypothetical protein
MTPTPRKRTHNLRRGNWLRLRSDPEQRPVPERDRLRFVRFGGENHGIRAKRRVSRRAGRGTMWLHGSATAACQVNWEMSVEVGRMGKPGHA